jgi:hypothetical protein
VSVNLLDTVARVRAQLLHILYELGKEDYQFRLRFKGQYLRDAFSVEDYGIYENAILKMIPLSKVCVVLFYLSFFFIAHKSIIDFVIQCNVSADDVTIFGLS